jgi:hypothetical protein
MDTRRLDAGRLDTRRLDTRRPDARRPDSRIRDEGARCPDAGRLDTGRLDTWTPDDETGWVDTKWWMRTATDGMAGILASRPPRRRPYRWGAVRKLRRADAARAISNPDSSIERTLP